MVCLPWQRPILIPVPMESGFMIMFGNGYSGPRPRPRPMGSVPNFVTNISTDKME